MVGIVIKLLDHLRYTFPRWPLVGAITTTWVSERYARLQHPGWRQQAPGGPALAAGHGGSERSGSAAAGLGGGDG